MLRAAAVLLASVDIEHTGAAIGERASYEPLPTVCVAVTSRGAFGPMHIYAGWCLALGMVATVSMWPQWDLASLTRICGGQGPWQLVHSLLVGVVGPAILLEAETLLG